MIRTKFRLVMMATAVLITSSVSAQQRNKPDTAKAPSPTPAAVRPPTGPKPYSEIITAKAVTDKGLFTVHKVEDKYYFEIGDSALRRQILVVNRISKAAAGMRSGGFFGYAGDMVGQNVISFDKGPGNKIFLRNISYAEYAKDSTSPMFTAVNNSNVQPIAAAFDIKAFSKDSTGYVIDISDYIGSDNDVLFFNSALKSLMRVGSLQSDKSYTVAVKSFPENIEITTVKTYTRAPAPSMGGPVGGGVTSGNFTVEMNSSLVALPKVAMQPRYFDPRVGYFAVGYTDYDANPQGVESIRMVKRWKLEPRDGDLEKYKAGQLVEPKKPIIFYIDPATPPKWIPYLMQGVNDWEKAFEHAGFKNAIMAKMPPSKEEDPEWSLEDARYSAIVYKPSDIANASGPSISDPRSGEIMESHINWYHNVMQLIHDWYFIQCAPLDSGARKMVFDDELMGQLIRFVSSHEVGHTLGLRHNYGSSSSVPVERLRDKAWVEANGHTPSIMDYARFNYVAQPEDKISRAGLFPRIGEYDDWAIEWGYKLFPQFNSADAETSFLNKWVIEELKNKRLWFGTETNPDDPRSQSEQVGDDPVKSSFYGIKNLQRIVPNLEVWTRQPNHGYQDLQQMYNELTAQFSRYMGHVTKNIGGILETPKTVEQAGVIYEVVPKVKQREAVEFLNKQLFTTPSWLINEDLFAKTGGNAVSTIGRLQESVLNRIFSVRTMGKLIDAEAQNGTEAYTLVDLFADMKKGIWSELGTRGKIDVYRRNLQKSYINILTGLIAPPKNDGASLFTFTIGAPPSASLDNSDIKSIVRAHLALIRADIRLLSNSTADPMTRYHLADIVSRIDSALDPK
ncbi:MAG: zinc-dependent metalloprotease [Chitinophagaceae bacterium]